MLNKLIKYDIKRVSKFLSIFYVLAFISALLTRMLFMIDNSFIIGVLAQICSGFTCAMIANILINTLMRQWIKFKSTLYDDESYLTHTLPVEKSSLYLSKIIVSIGSVILSVIVIFLTLFIAYYSKENIEALKDMLLPLANLYNSSIFRVVLLFITAFMVETLCILQSGYTGIIMGHKMNNNKILFSIVYGFIVYISTQLFALGIVFLMGLFNKNLMNLFITNEVLNIETVKVVGYICIFIYTIIFIVNYFININLFKKGVNVD